MSHTGKQRLDNVYQAGISLPLSLNDGVIALSNADGGADSTIPLPVTTPDVFYNRTEFGKCIYAFLRPDSAAVFNMVYGNGPAHSKGTGAFIGGVFAPNGKVILAPHSSANVGLVFLNGLDIDCGYWLHPYLNKL
jgi:hypothetical protein